MKENIYENIKSHIKEIDKKIVKLEEQLKVADDEEIIEKLERKLHEQKKLKNFYLNLQKKYFYIV